MNRIPDPKVQPTLSVGEAAVLLGVGRSTAYEAARSGVLPTLAFGGRRLRVPTAALYRLLGIAPFDDETQV